MDLDTFRESCERECLFVFLLEFPWPVYCLMIRAVDDLLLNVTDFRRDIVPGVLRMPAFDGLDGDS